jgi:multiple sugar transport system permease protein
VNHICKGTIAPKNHIRDGQVLSAWLLSAPALIIIGIFMITPFVMSIVYSFSNKAIISTKPFKFIGFSNYIKLLSSSIARQAFLNTLKYTLIVVPFIVVFATLLAIFINKKIKGIAIFRMIYFSPQVVTMTVVAVIWSFIFSPNSEGLMNSFLHLFGIQPQTWLKDEHLAIICIAVMSIWQALGLQMVIVLGGLQYIPEDLYEAGYMDGCNAFQKLWFITLPMLKNTLVYVLISNTIYALRLFTQVYVLTEGGPKNSTTSVVYLMYQAGFINNQVGYASAMAVVFFLAVLVISLVQNKVVGDD